MNPQPARPTHTIDNRSALNPVLVSLQLFTLSLGDNHPKKIWGEKKLFGLKELHMENVEKCEEYMATTTSVTCI